MWVQEETKVSLGLWVDASVQTELKGVERNKSVFIKVGNKMKEKGYEKMWKQCQMKVKNKIAKYGKMRERNS